MKSNFSRIIQGCMGWGAWGKQLSENEMIERIHHCMENGITSFDHADIYGDYTTEADFGNAFKNTNVERENVQLISKCGIQYMGNTRDNKIKHYQYDAAYIIWCAEKSIKDLNADYLDLLLLHRPSPLMHPEEIEKAIDKLKMEGKIKEFGVSNFTAAQTQLIEYKSAVFANQIEFSLTHFNAMWDGSLDYMLSNSIMPMCWSPLGSVFKEQNEQTERIKKKLVALSKKYNATKDQLMLAWILKHPSKIYPVIGTSNLQRIEAASKATEIDLSTTDWFELLVASQGHKVA